MAPGSSSPATKRVVRAASSINSLTADPGRELYSGTTKDASHAAFYPGVAKGFASAMSGLVLFISSPPLRARVASSLRLLKSAHLPLVAAFALLFVVARDPADDWATAVFALSRWARLVTLFSTFVLDRKYKAREDMFFTATTLHSPAFSAALKAAPQSPLSRSEKFQRAKRVAKMSALRIASIIIKRMFPGAAVFATPALTYISTVPTLGTPVALAVAAVHVLPSTLLASWSLDEAVLSFSEAILDSDDMGNDLMRPFVRRLDGEDARVYFRNRYRGYLVGCGFVFSCLTQIPLAGIAIGLIGECGAAVCVVDIVSRNSRKEQHSRMALVGEHALVASKHE
jgi:hypothetical protein